MQASGGNARTGRGGRSPDSRVGIVGSAVVALAVALAAILVVPAVAAGAAGTRADPAVPVLTTPLRQGVDTDPDAVRWLEGRLAVILPRIHWSGGALPTDGVFDARTTTAVKWFQMWANIARSEWHRTPLFAAIDGVVGPATASLIAIVAAYFERHPSTAPAGPTPAPTPTGPPDSTASVTPTADQATALAALNADRSAYGVGSLALLASLTAKAQAWSAHLADVGALAHNDQTSGLSGCWRTVAENVGYGSSIAWIEHAFIVDAGVNPPTHRLNIENRAFTLVGIGVTYRNGTYWVVQDFMQPC